jgi:membrane protein DedA with SNARE-associated domain
MLNDVINWIVSTVGDLGYIGIFVMMFLESSFFPFPSEVVMVPAGYLASKGEMSLILAILFGVGGSLAGAIFNYLLALKFGRAFLLKYGKYIFLKEESLNKLESFFEEHGEISTFSGRLIPGIRQYISLPAGLAKMSLARFSFFTTLGAAIWVVVLALVGYYIGENETLVKEYLKQITVAAIALIAVVVAIYYFLKRR